MVGYRDIDLKEINLDSWFEDREIQEFIEQIEKKSNRTVFKSGAQNQSNFKVQESPKDLSKDPALNSDNFEEGRLPLPGGVKEDNQEVIEENIYTDETVSYTHLTLPTIYSV